MRLSRVLSAKTSLATAVGGSEPLVFQLRLIS